MWPNPLGHIYWRSAFMENLIFWAVRDVFRTLSNIWFEVFGKNN